MPLSETIKPVTTRLFGDDFMDFQDLINAWKRKLEDLSIAESEAANAAIRRIIIMATPERRIEEAKRLGLSKEDTPAFEAWCDWFMDGYFNDLKEVMSRRDAMDKRKNRKTQP